MVFADDMAHLMYFLFTINTSIRMCTFENENSRKTGSLALRKKVLPRIKFVYW